MSVWAQPPSVKIAISVCIWHRTFMTLLSISFYAVCKLSAIHDLTGASVNEQIKRNLVHLTYLQNLYKSNICLRVRGCYGLRKHNN
ncbi:hypothetical protein ALT717_200016 [Alteromonas macleodii]